MLNIDLIWSSWGPILAKLRQIYADSYTEGWNHVDISAKKIIYVQFMKELCGSWTISIR